MIYTIVGARPNFIKIDPELSQQIIHTGQHKDYRMSRIFFTGLKLKKPLYNLGCTDVGKMIDKIRDILKRDKPELVLVIGDTNSALAGALAASMENIKIAHVEAGLRSYDLTMPEEKNRVIIDKLSYVLFCPNETAAMNLLKEGIKENVHIVGDPLFDSMGRFTPFKKSKDFGQYILLTAHRNFNVDNKEKLQAILIACELSKEKIVWPLHPRTKKMLHTNGVEVPKNVDIIAPQGYKQMLTLISNAKKVITDSGGVQREAYWMQIPVIILREETEWTEIINKGGGVLTGTDTARILSAIQTFTGSSHAPPNPFVNKRIRNLLYRYA